MRVVAKRTMIVLGVCCALLLGAAAQALAAPTWLGPVALSATGHDAEKPQVVTDAHGDTLAVWERYNGSIWVIEAAGRQAGSGAWQAPVVVSASGVLSEKPALGIDAQGDAVVAWVDEEAGGYKVEVTTRTGSNGVWQTPAGLSSAVVKDPKPQVAIDVSGDAVVTWHQEDGSSFDIEAASKPAGSASWRAPVTLSKAGAGEAAVRVGIDARGVATAVWEQDEGGDVVIAAATGDVASGIWQAPVRISPSPEAAHNANEPRVAVDAQGDVVAVWERFSETEIIEAATIQAASGKWQTPVAISKPEAGKEPGDQQVAIDGRGDAVVVWQRSDGKNEIIEATVGKPATGTWQATVALSQAGESAGEPQVSLDAQGDAVAVWQRSNGKDEIVEAAAGQALSGSWQPAVVLSQAGEEAHEPQVVVDPQGNATAIWQRSDGKDLIVEADGYDAAGPLLGALAIPATAGVGQTLSFSVSPLDVWSALGVTSWSFGDGSSGVGTSVTHAYAKAGTYSVTVSSADVLGNVTSASGTVVVASPAFIGKSLPIIHPVPVISDASLSPSRFRVAKRGTAISAKISRGTTFHFTLSEAAKLQIAFTRSLPGLRGGRHCLAPSLKLRHKHAGRCTRTVTLGTLTRALEHQGVDSLAFSGRIGRRALAPGRYKAVLTASGEDVRSLPVTLSLTVVR